MQSAREPHSAHTASPADPPPLSSHGGGHSAHCPTHMARHNDADLGLTLRTDGLPAESRVSESETERRLREERENSEKNQLSLIRMLRQHTQNLLVSNNILLHKTQGQDEPVDQDVIRRQDLSRTASMVSHGSGPMEMMSRKYKLVTSSVLWFCYFSLVSGRVPGERVNPHTHRPSTTTYSVPPSATSASSWRLSSRQWPTLPLSGRVPTLSALWVSDSLAVLANPVLSQGESPSTTPTDRSA